MSYEGNQSTYGRLCDEFPLVAIHFRDEDYYELYRLVSTLYPCDASLDQKLKVIHDLAERLKEDDMIDMPRLI